MAWELDRIFYIREGRPAWPVDTRSVGRSAPEFPFRAERKKGADFFIFMWTTGGTGFLEAGHRKYIMKQGWIYIMPPGIPHAYGTARPEEPWNTDWFTMDGKLAPDLMTELGLNRLIVKKVGVPPEMIFQRLLATVNDPGLVGSMDRTQNAIRLLYDLSAKLKRKYSGRKHKRFQDLIGWAGNNIGLDMNVEFLARKAGLSRSHFSREFSNEIGLTPVQFVLELKLNKAKELLLNTDMSVKEVARESGFFDAAHFCRQFSKFTGFSPAIYRRQAHV
jgi:AraC-like DNA-binding protein